jgi:hypothetical protein
MYPSSETASGSRQEASSAAAAAASSQGLTPMNIAVIRAKVWSREVSERKQVGDAESLVNREDWSPWDQDDDIY